MAMRQYVIGLGLLLVTQAAMAQKDSYQYLETGFQLTDIEVADGDGGGIAASGLFKKHWILFGRYAEATLSGPINGAEVDADWEFVRVGFGYRHELPGWSDTDGYLLLSYNEIDLSDFESGPEGGEDFEFGINHALRHNIEVNVAARYFNSSIEGVDLLAGDAGFKAGLYWRFLPTFGLGVAYEDIGNFSELTASLRAYW